MSNKADFAITKGEVVVVKEGQTALVISGVCGETYCMAVQDNSSFDDFVLSTDKQFVKQQCEARGFPKNFILKDTNNADGVCYLISEHSTTGVAIAIEEVNTGDCGYRLMKSRVNIIDWKPQEKTNQNEDKKDMGMD